MIAGKPLLYTTSNELMKEVDPRTQWYFVKFSWLGEHYGEG